MQYIVEKKHIFVYNLQEIEKILVIIKRVGVNIYVFKKNRATRV